MADEQSPLEQERAEPKSKSKSSGSGGSGGSGPVGAGKGGSGGSGASRSGAGFFTIYKRGQGYWTRMGTLLGAVLIGLLTAEFLYTQTKSWGGATLGVAIGVALGFLAVYSFFVWRLMNKPGNVDFLIATDSEMKKVNWTSRKELIGSTKVVVFFVVLISLTLFLLDVIFGYLFQLIRVLETGPFG